MTASLAAMSPLQLSRRPRVRTGTTLALLLGLAASPLAQGAKPDQVLWRNARGQVNTIAGKVSENSLTQVLVDTGSTERKIEALSVERVEFGDVPQAFTDARLYQERGDLENAAAKYTLAAGDAAARPVVRARARLRAAETWARHGAADPAGLVTARKECEQFLSEFAGNREVPQARLLLGRLERLTGDAAKAAETYSALHKENGTAGYPLLLCAQAGLAAGEAFLAAKDVPKAREIYLTLDGQLGSALANLSDSDPLRGSLLSIQAEARLGEGFCLLASGSVAQAKTFFQGQITSAEGQAARRFSAQLGLGEALLAEGNARAAQLEFAQVSAIDHTSLDRTARALVGLAESAIKLDARSDAKQWLETVRTRHGDTPAVLRAQELLKTL